MVYAARQNQPRFVDPPDLEAMFPPEAKTGCPRVIPVRDNCFDGVLDVERAYWLGFIYADGSITFKPRWTLSVHLAARDEPHVVDLRDFVGGRVSPTKAGAVRLLVHSRALCLSLARQGVLPRKSFAPAAPPSLDGDRRLALLRGIFDGNGCLHVTRRGHLQAAFCGHPAVVAWFVDQVGVATNGTPRIRGGAAYAQWTSGQRAAELTRALYGAPGPRLARKAAVARRYLA